MNEAEMAREVIDDSVKEMKVSFLLPARKKLVISPDFFIMFANDSRTEYFAAYHVFR